MQFVPVSIFFSSFFHVLSCVLYGTLLVALTDTKINPAVRVFFGWMLLFVYSPSTRFRHVAASKHPSGL